MRIAVNLIPFFSVQGIEIYAQNLVSNLIKIDRRDDFFILISEDAPQLFNFPQANFIKIKGLKGKYGKILKAVYLQFKIYPLLKKYKIDFLFSPCLAAPFFYKNKLVVIHDCAYDRFLEFENIVAKIYFKTMFYGAKYFSQKTITSSNFSKKELVKFYRINTNKIEVIYGGVPEMPEVKEEFIQKTLNKFKIKKHYFLYVGNFRPRKNLPGLIKAFKLFRESSGLDYLLIVAGRKDKRFLDLEKEIKKIKLEKNVILTGFVSQKEKTALYKKAGALIFPSFYEGFGLPILEAQSMGTPVLTSNISSLPEITRNSALLVNPYNIKDIAKGMEKIVLDDLLRQELIKKGFENIKRFSWEKSAQKLLNLFHSL